MNKNQIIQDYGTTVNPQVYIDALQAHPYIPQSDQCIRNLVAREFSKKQDGFGVLDVGCGPDRLTSSFANIINQADVIGVDISESFIDFAIEKVTGKINPLFLKLDFANTKDLQVLQDKMPFNVITMQGVMHHIHGSNRDKFFINAHNLLANDGVLIIGDEFIADYDSNMIRRDNIAKFYCHIIDEARKGGFNDLAEEEAKNLIDDYFSGTEYAGYGDSRVFECIYEFSQKINTEFYTRGVFGEFSKLIDLMEKNVQRLIETGEKDITSFNRGDYKVSIEKFVAEITEYGFTPSEAYKFGPVDQLGGMGVLIFKNK